MILYTADIHEANGKYTLSITNHRLNTTQSIEVPPHMVDQIPMLLNLLHMMK